MKQITFILLFISFNAFTQKSETIRIDSLPIYGAFLEKGWTWHLGDSPDYAKADFDDSTWESIDPTKDIMELPQLPKTGEIFWFRFHQSIDSSRMQQLVMMIFQSGASEFYLNGKLIHSFGVLSKNPLEIKAFTPFFKPVSLPIQPITSQVLAVRYAFQPNISYSSSYGYRNLCLGISVNSIENGNERFAGHTGLGYRIIAHVAAFSILCLFYFTT